MRRQKEYTKLMLNAERYIWQNPETGAVHACGHNAQCAAPAGIAAALKEPGILEKLCGKIKLCPVSKRMTILPSRTACAPKATASNTVRTAVHTFG